MLKVNSGPGRSDKEFLAWCRARGIIVYLGVPNTTAIEQDMDQSYYVSLAALVEHRLKTASASGQQQMGAADYVMLIFGRKEGSLELPNLFEQYFSIEKLKHCCEKIGAVPLFRKCLLSPQVRHEIVMNDGAINLTADPQATHLATILAKNKEACNKVCNLGHPYYHFYSPTYFRPYFLTYFQPYSPMLAIYWIQNLYVRQLLNLFINCCLILLSNRYISISCYNIIPCSTSSCSV
jgi:hypothetical protein